MSLSSSDEERCSLARGSALEMTRNSAKLRRIAIGPLTVDKALALSSDDAEAAATALARLVPLDAVPLTCPNRFLAPGDVDRFLRGIPVATGPDPSNDGEEWAARAPGGSLLGIGVASGGVFRPRVVLARDEGDRGLPEKNGV